MLFGWIGSVTNGQYILIAIAIHTDMGIFPQRQYPKLSHIIPHIPIQSWIYDYVICPMTPAPAPAILRTSKETTTSAQEETVK